MSFSVPTPATVLEAVDTLAPPGTPVTTAEVAEAFDCTPRTIYNKLESLVDNGELETKKVGARGRVWWRPPTVRVAVDSSLTVGTDQDAGDVEPRDALRNSEERLRLALDAGELGAWELDLQTMESPVRSPLHDRIFGYQEPVDDWSFDRFIEHVHPDDRDDVVQSFEAAFETGEWSVDCRIVRADDERRWITGHGEFFFDDGEPVRAVGVVQDVTERKEREQELERYARIIDTIGEPVYELDDQGRFTFVNDALLDTSGYRESELLGQHASLGMDAAAIDRVQSKILAQLKDGGGGSIVEEYEVTTKDGERVPTENRLTLLTDEDGWLRSSVGVLFDVSQRRQREQELETRVRQLNAIAELGQQALANRDLDELMAEATRLVADTLDNDYCKVLDLDDTGEALLLRQGVGWADGIVGSGTVSAVDDDSQAAHTLASRHPIVVEDLSTESRFSGPELLTSHGVRSGISTIIGPFDDPWGVLGTHDTDTREFSEHDVNFVQSIANILATAINRHADEQALVHSRNELQEREQALQESERRYRTLVENFPNGIVALFDEDLRYLIAGGALYEEIDRTAEQTLGRTLYQNGTPEEIELLEPRYLAALDGESSSFELEYAGRTLHFWVVAVTNGTGDVVAGMAMSQDVTDRKRREQQLATLNHLNETALEVTHSIIDSSTRDEIEQIVCDHLTNSDTYSAAWVGRLDHSGQTITPRGTGTTSDARSELSLVDTGDGPKEARTIARALETRSVHVTHDVTDAGFEPADGAQPDGRRSLIVAPITYEDQVYGTLNVYTAREGAFDESEQQVMGRVGKVVGHAFTSLERKQALLEDRAHELTFRTDTLGGVEIETDGDVTISTDRTIQVTDDRFISYYTIDGLTSEAVVELVDRLYADAICHVVHEEGLRSRLEVETTEETLAAKLASYGWRTVEAVLRDGALRFTVQVPRETEVAQVVDTVRSVYADAELVSQTTVVRESRAPGDVFAAFDDALTERQRTALAVAYYGGFFNWPRDSTGEDLAERLDVSPSTLHHHLRHGEQKLLSAFFDGAGR